MFANLENFYHYTSLYVYFDSLSVSILSDFQDRPLQLGSAFLFFGKQLNINSTCLWHVKFLCATSIEKTRQLSSSPLLLLLTHLFLNSLSLEITYYIRLVCVVIHSLLNSSVIFPNVLTWPLSDPKVSRLFLSICGHFLTFSPSFDLDIPSHFK